MNVEFEHARYTIKKSYPFFSHSFFGDQRNRCWIYTPDGRAVLFVREEGDDIRVTTDPSLEKEVLRLSWSDQGASRWWRNRLEVADSVNGQVIGALVTLVKARGEGWSIRDAQDREVSQFRPNYPGWVRYVWFGRDLIPRSFAAYAADEVAFTFRQKFNPWTVRIDLDFTMGAADQIDRRLAIAVCACEGVWSGATRL